MKINRGLIFLLFFLLTYVLSAQETGEPAAEETVEKTEDEGERLSTREIQQINMELRTSTLSELAVWCRTLGLSESGTREELSSRIRGHFRLSETASAENKKIITIESAQTSEYFSIDTIGEEYARLKGDVRISLKDGEKIHKISANEMLFNRTRNNITSSGNVFYEKTEGKSLETFRGESLTVDIDNWSSVLLDGNSEKRIESDGSAYLFSGKVISRSDEEATVIKNATISNASDEETSWSINASKLWLLPGSDFAVLNAVLKVGEIPVLYIPFLYYPGDELVFHPVIGFRSREGAFVQTTTYIIGQPKADSTKQNSISKIIGNSDESDMELQGLFLHSTGKKTVDPNKISLKAMLDYYVNLGTYAGIDFSAPKKGIINQTDLSLGIGFTRTISMIGGNYTPYVPDGSGYYDGSYNWNHSNLFSTLVPFRYRMTFSSSISGAYGGLSWSFPFYSDPTVDKDLYTNRSESMDWMNMIQQGAALSDSISDTKISEYRWNVSGTVNPSIPSLSPYISRITVSEISTTLTFRQSEDFSKNIDAPERYFYAPLRYVIYNFSGSIAGNPVTIGRKQKKNEPLDESQTPQQIDPFKGVGSPVSPWSTEKNEQTKTKSSDILSPPALANNFNVYGAGNNIFSVNYTLSPSSSSELQFMTNDWKTYEDVNWNEYQSILMNVTGRGVLNFRLDHSSGLYSNTVSFSGDAVWQDYTYMNENAYADETAMENERKRQYGRTNYMTTYAYNSTVRPLYGDAVFGQSNLQYMFGGTLVKSKKYNNGNGPELTPEWGSWVKEDRSRDIYGLNSHRVAANLDANVMDKRQNFSLSADLPPLDGLISTDAGIRFWISETLINTKFEKPSGEDDWIFRPIYFTETLRFTKSNYFSYFMVIDPEKSEIDRINSTLKLWNFTAIFSAVTTARSVFNSGTGSWYTTGDPTLLPKELTFIYDQTSSNIEIIKNRINLTFNLRSTLKYDLQQHTKSSFEFVLGLTANISGFLSLNLSFTSLNSVIWRYFKDFPGMESSTSMYPDGPQNNLFIDLFDSFNFFDESKRRRTGFKMQRFDLTAKHYLGDWEAELKVGILPLQDPSGKYGLNTEVSFLVKWTPIPEIKTDYKYYGKDNKWKKQ